MGELAFSSSYDDLWASRAGFSVARKSLQFDLRHWVNDGLMTIFFLVVAPSTARLQPEFIDSEQLNDLSDAQAVHTTTEIARGSVSVVEWLQHVLHPWTSYFIVPIFAFANSGIKISVDGLRDAAGSAITWGVLLGLLVGKPIGVVVATRLTIRSGAADRPEGTTSRQVIEVGAGPGASKDAGLREHSQLLSEPHKLAEPGGPGYRRGLFRVGRCCATSRNDSEAR